MKTHLFHISGMHCASCVLLTESELTGVRGIVKARASLAAHTLEVTGDFGNTKPTELAHELTTMLAPHGYSVSIERQKHGARWRDFIIAAPAAGAFIGLFIVLQKLGIVNLITASQVTYGTAFVIGLVASVSTCMAVVGGLTLSISANFAKVGDRIRPQILFHAARLISFFVLGGIIGTLGATFQIGATGAFTMGIAVAIVLLILGINLLDIFPWIKKFQLVTPRFISRRAHALKDINHSLTPALLGVATFFLPCGFTQSMQLYSLSTGSFWAGSLTMLSFALGTLPVLAFLSFGALGLHTKAQSGIFFKAAGLVVIFFAIFNLVTALVAFGVIPPILTI